MVKSVSIRGRAAAAGAAVCAAAVVIAVLGGCSKKTAGEPAAMRGGGITLRVGIWDKNQEGGITSVLKDFTAETGIKAAVEITPWEQYWTLLEAGATGGSLPDVFWMHLNQVVRYETNGMLMDLTDRIAKSGVADLDNFPADLVALYTHEGKHYGIPKDWDTIALWYNKTYFDEAGLAYPDETWDWAALKEAAKKLTTKDHWGFASVISNQSCNWNFVFQNGGWIISPDKKQSGYSDPKTVEAIQFLVDLVKEGWSPDLNTSTENNGDVLFESGKVAMVYTGSWLLPEYAGNEYVAANCDLAILPKGPAGKRATIYNGLAWVADANGAHQEEAWKLLEFFSRKDVQQKLSESGIAISAYNGTAGAWTNKDTRFNLKAYTEEIGYGVFYPWSDNGVVWHNMAERELRDAWLGNKSVQAVCATITAEMNKALAEE